MKSNGQSNKAGEQVNTQTAKCSRITEACVLNSVQQMRRIPIESEHLESSSQKMERGHGTTFGAAKRRVTGWVVDGNKEIGIHRGVLQFVEKQPQK